MVAPLDNVVVEAQVLPLSDLRVEFDQDPKELKSRRDMDRHSFLVLPDGQKLRPTERFWSSFSSLCNLGRSVFDYFPHQEVFNRITKVRQDRVRIAYHPGHRKLQDQQGDASAGGGSGAELPGVLSCTNPTKPILPLDQVRRLVEDHDGHHVAYADGVVTSSFECPFPLEFSVGGDGFRTQFTLQMPVDGYGLPAAYLALLRLICTNGMTALNPAFKTVFQLGQSDRDLHAVLDRAMLSFANEEGFHAIRQRVDSASRSWASLREASLLQNALTHCCHAEHMGLAKRSEILSGFDKACGSPLVLYGLSSANEISSRRAAAIPVEATVYDLMNYASEVATHHMSKRLNRERLNAWIGQALTSEYDLEGTVETFPDYKDYFLESLDTRE